MPLARHAAQEKARATYYSFVYHPSTVSPCLLLLVCVCVFVTGRESRELDNLLEVLNITLRISFTV
jgi:hypothetical protein